MSNIPTPLLDNDNCEQYETIQSFSYGNNLNIILTDGIIDLESSKSEKHYDTIMLNIEKSLDN